jgi:hypothetical protein
MGASRARRLLQSNPKMGLFRLEALEDFHSEDCRRTVWGGGIIIGHLVRCITDRLNRFNPDGLGDDAALHEHVEDALTQQQSDLPLGIGGYGFV